MSLTYEDPVDLKNIQVACSGDCVLVTIDKNDGSVRLSMEQTDRLIQLLLIAKSICKDVL